jgi:hypothetical protein
MVARGVTLRLPARLLLAALLPCALAACGGGAPEPSADETDIPDAIASGEAETRPVRAEVEGATPIAEREVTLGVLNKRNNLTQDLTMKPGETRRIGNLVVRVRTCEKTAPGESPEEEGAFVQLFVEERPSGQEPFWRKVFSGWLFRNSPALNVVEHPVYDVWVKKCAMNFPVSTPDSPGASASASSAANPSATESAAPTEPDAEPVAAPAEPEEDGAA